MLGQGIPSREVTLILLELNPTSQQEVNCKIGPSPSFPDRIKNICTLFRLVVLNTEQTILGTYWTRACSHKAT